MKLLHFSRVVLAGCAAILAASVTACGSQPESRPSAAGKPATINIHQAQAIDTYKAHDVAFYRQFAPGDAVLSVAEHYTNLAEGVAASTAVIVAEVVAVEPTRIVRGEHPEDVLPMTGVALRPVARVAGQLPAGETERLTVEFMGNPESVKESLPTQQALWFLRKKGQPARPGEPPIPVSAEEAQYWRVISPQGLFVQGATHVDAPLAEQIPDDMAAEGRRYGRMSDLISYVERAS